MLRTPFRRSSRSRYLRLSLVILCAVLFIDVLSILTARHRAIRSTKDPPDVRGQRVFIASIHWNNEKILRSHWNKAVLDLVAYFGRDNVYVSIQESGSWDDSKGALRELDQQLGELDVPRTIILDKTTHADEIAHPPAGDVHPGWIDTPRGKRELRRIPYLAKLRNISLRPLKELEAANETRFDKVLFLNDVVFTTSDVAQLMNTRDGDYAAACSLDFSKPPHYYDTFALRDSSGHEAATSTFPFFRSQFSRDAIVSGEPVPVQSCWNGIVAFDAAPFYAEPQDGGPLEFRGISDSLAKKHLEGSECCLVHVDNPLTKTRGVWQNPAVRVGYNPEAYEAVHTAQGGVWPGLRGCVVGVWRNRVARLMTNPWFKERIVKRRVMKWNEQTQEDEKGVSCLINEMQTLIINGWAHV